MILKDWLALISYIQRLMKNIDPRVLKQEEVSKYPTQKPVDVLFQNEKVYTNINL